MVTAFIWFANYLILIACLPNILEELGAKFKISIWDPLQKPCIDFSKQNKNLFWGKKVEIAYHV